MMKVQIIQCRLPSILQTLMVMDGGINQRMIVVPIQVIVTALLLIMMVMAYVTLWMMILITMEYLIMRMPWISTMNLLQTWTMMEFPTQMTTILMVMDGLTTKNSNVLVSFQTELIQTATGWKILKHGRIILLCHQIMTVIYYAI